MARRGGGARLIVTRFFTDAPFEVGSLVALSEDERRHAKARRLRNGSAVVLLDGRGRRGRGELVDVSVQVHQVELDVGEDRRPVAILLAAAEPARVEWAIEKGTECGAASFTLFAAERSQAAHVRALTARLGRLRKISVEAVKQCDRSVVPPVLGVVSLEAALRDAPRPLAVALPGGAEPSPGLRAVAIGPEGGFTPAEERLFAEGGASGIGLGRRVLRLETAVVVALARLVDPA